MPWVLRSFSRYILGTKHQTPRYPTALLTMYHVPNTQTLRHPSFKSTRQLLEQKGQTAPSIIEWIADHNPEHPFFVYHDGTKLNEVSWRRVRDGIHRAAHYFSDRVKGPTSTTDRPVIAILASTGEFFLLRTMSNTSVSFRTIYRFDHILDFRHGNCSSEHGCICHISS